MGRVATILNLALQLTANLSVAFAPFLPFSSKKLSDMLAMQPRKWDSLGNMEMLEEGHLLNKAELLFDKIEDAAIEAQIKKLQDTKKQNEINEKHAEPVKELVDIEQFGKLDIRVGTVLECSKVPKSDKLLQFKIDDGMGGRTIVSGIAAYYKPEDLIGKQVCFVANLPVRKLRGVESNGMIISAQDADGSYIVVSPSRKVANGSQIS